MGFDTVLHILPGYHLPNGQPDLKLLPQIPPAEATYFRVKIGPLMGLWSERHASPGGRCKFLPNSRPNRRVRVDALLMRHCRTSLGQPNVPLLRVVLPGSTQAPSQKCHSEPEPRADFRATGACRRLRRAS